MKELSKNFKNLFFLLFFFYLNHFFSNRSEKRAAWRQARLKSLEQDANQAKLMLQNLNNLTEEIETSDVNIEVNSLIFLIKKNICKVFGT